MAHTPSRRLHRVRTEAEGFVGELGHLLIDAEIDLSEAARTVEAETHAIVSSALTSAASAGRRWSKSRENPTTKAA